MTSKNFDKFISSLFILVVGKTICYISHTVISYCKLIVLLNKCLLLSSTHTFIIIEREDKRPRITKSENTLKRGSACITCRRRKMVGLGVLF